MSTIYRGHRPTAPNIIDGAGTLRAFLVSHDQTTVQTLTFYDNTAASGTILLVVHVDPTRCPTFARFAPDEAVRFATGLSYAAANCEIAVWALAF